MLMLRLRCSTWRSLRPLTYSVSNTSSTGPRLNDKTKYTVTVDTIFSPENKERVMNSLLGVEPIRSVNDLTDKKKSNLLSEKKRKNNSAVLIPLCLIDGQPSILFTLRSTSLRNHRGEVSFPGGRTDDDDHDLVHTALRETQEELGLHQDKVDVWGLLRPVPNKDGTSLATPVLAFCGDVKIDELNPNTDEVEVVFTRSIKSLVDPNNISSTQFRFGRSYNGRGYTLPVYTGGEYRIWGLTAIFLHQTLTLIAPSLYNYKIIHHS